MINPVFKLRIQSQSDNNNEYLSIHMFMKHQTIVTDILEIQND